MKRNPVNCCELGAQFLNELPNDQQADPGWRHIRILTSNDGGTLSSRARFCPWCGTCFREEPRPFTAADVMPGDW